MFGLCIYLICLKKLNSLLALGVVKNVIFNFYDIFGRAVAKLINRGQKSGDYEVEFEATNYTSEIYFYRLTAGEFVETKKMILMK